MYAPHVGPPAPPPPSGMSAAVVVLLWVFVGWPLSWLLLFVFFPLGILFGVGITVAMIVVLAQSNRTSPQVVVNVGHAPPVPPMPQMPPAHAAVRRQVEGLAEVNAVGGCGWCGYPAAHVTDQGYQIHPRQWHAAEIEERVREKLRH